MANEAQLLQQLSSTDTPVPRLRNMVRTIYRITRRDPSTVTPLLTWTPLYTILLHPDAEVRLYTAHTLSIVLGMSDRERKKFIDKHAQSADSSNASVIRLIEDELDAAASLQLFCEADANIFSGTSPKIITSVDLSAATVDLAGVLLPAGINRTDKSPTALVPTLTTRRNLHAIALALSLNVPILLEGGPGVGKTALVEQAARSLGRHKTLLKIHLGDQTDAKVLLGTYICTSTPGSFRWQPGVLTTAVMEGRWILFEDIDLAPLEVVSVLIPLLETGWLFVASRGEKVRAKEGFRVFGTRSVGTNRSAHAQAAGEGLWHKVPIASLNEDEVVEVIENLFPRLKAVGVQGQILKAFKVIEALYKDKMVSGGRSASLRDLIKWCDRVEYLTKERTISNGNGVVQMNLEELPLSVREDLLREAADCFTESMPTKALRDGVLEKIGAQLGVASHRVQFYCDVHVPSMYSTSDAVAVGRVALPKRPRDPLQVSAQRPYAPTPSSLRLMERLSVSIVHNEPILLVGETGTGKTTVIQHLAHLTNTPLTVINMSQQSDSSDLLGGFKPVDVRVLAVSVLNEFEQLFASTFSVKANVAFLEGVRRGFKGGRWNTFVKGCRMGVKMANDVFTKLKGAVVAAEPQAKKQKTKRVYDAQLESQWQKFAKTLATFDSTHQKVSASLLFSFIEGALVKALREGHWVLLDEINLATPETLDCLTGLLASATSSLVLLERGDTEPVARHPGFRLFGCMNPANDAGKKELSIGLRGRFTEFWVDAPDATFADLVTIVKQYLQSVLPPSKDGDKLCEDIARFYTTVRGYAAQGLVYDGADHRVHYSMRTLARALMFAVATTVNGIWILRRGVWEGCCMTFGTGLGDKSRVMMEAVLKETVAEKINVHRGVKSPDMGDEITHVGVGGYWLPLGPLPALDVADQSYILTETVTQNLAYLARAVMSGKYPVLIQGPTSAGKTSMVEYLAKLTGHTCVRVNNHEGTEVAEYVGGWGEAEETAEGGRGRLVWQEGILVTALRKGHWLILDELNLAPSDVLESLNRLLDDNRELFIPETQTTIRPHPSFMLFATQNPAGTTYGGRKQLSRAFRNRFLEIHFGDIPTPELHIILEKRCQIAPSYAKAIVAVYKALQSTRGRGRVFEGRHGFVTLRDLFRWAGRGSVGYEELATEGWCLLGERMRSDEDRAVVREVIERELRVKVDVEGMYEQGFERVLAEGTANGAVGGLIDKLVWTPTTKRLFTLVWKCVTHNEPVLLVGDTGAGKTTVCQVVATMCGQELRIVNAHQGSEVGDFVGGMRPVRGREEMLVEAWEALNAVKTALGFESESMDLQVVLKEMETAFEQSMEQAPEVQELLTLAKTLVGKSQTLFTWRDGPLTLALREGSHFLLDEISLADDSVLERLNSVLEPSQFLLLSEKGCAEALYASQGFRFLATMNPGGDYGKKELSPALRNRFCEIWVPGVTGRGDLDGLVAKKLTVGGIAPDRSVVISKWMMDFYDWFAARLRKPRDAIVSLRDVLAWVEFVVGVASRNVMDLEHAFVHGGCMVIVDGIGVNPAFGVVSGVEAVRREVRACLLDLCGRSAENDEFDQEVEILDTDETFGVHPFFIAKGPEPAKEVQFSFMAPTTLRNLSRVLRALQLSKPVLLEGSPGVGKTSLVTTLAQLTGHTLTRINLSEQTDLTDLFGTDLPVEGTGNAGRFAWRDGPFLNAMKRGEWVLLDELNLASQQVLEGLNACLDHRGEVYIPELDRVFQKGPGFRVFAAQNPQGQGGGRKGLPRSFVNRFTSVYIEALSEADVGRIITNIFGAGIEVKTIEDMVRFNERMKEETMEKMRFGTRGGPWEFNLRDVVRWVELVKSGGDPQLYVEMMYAQRMRTPADREKVRALFNEVFADADAQSLRRPQWWVTENRVMIGCAQVERKSNRGGPGTHGSVPIDQLHMLPSTIPSLETLLKCVEMNYMPILTGPAGSGKTSLVRMLAGLCGVTLKEFSMNPGVDSVELLGGFEQADAVRARKVVVGSIGRVVEATVRELVVEAPSDGVRIGTQVMTEWDGVLSTVEKGGVAGLDAFVDQLEQLVIQLSLDLPARSLPAFTNIRDLIVAYKDTLMHGTHGTFEWVDGTLIKAMEEGHWILLDNVNLCPASVLDRLNPLLESGGVLNVTERGLDASGEVRVVGKRTGFRIFMCLDERFGEVSRAMRNRGVELFVDGEMGTGSEDAGRVIGGGPLTKIVKDTLAAHIMENANGQEQRAVLEVTEIRKMRMYARLLAERVQRGDSVAAAVTASLRDVYDKEVVVQQRKNIEDRQTAFASPMIAPQFISGRLVRDESCLARVAMDGAYLQYVCLQSNELPHRTKLLSAAAKVFVEGLSADDIIVRREWAALLIKSLRHDDLQAKWTLGAVLAAMEDTDSTVQELRDGLCASSGLEPAAIHGLPTDLRQLETRVGLDVRRAAHQWESYVAALQVRSVRSRLRTMQLAESQVGASRKGIYTVLDKSRLHASFKIGESELEHPCVAVFWPLIEALRAAVARWTAAYDGVHQHVESINKVLDQRDRLWECLQGADLPFEETFVALGRLRKALESCAIYTTSANDEGADEDSARLRTLVERAAEHLGLNSLAGVGSLWKHGSVAVLKKRELYDVERSFANVNQELSVWAADPHFDAATETKSTFWGGIGHPAVAIDELSRQSIVEGVATLYYLNEENSQQSAAGTSCLVGVLADVPGRILDKVRKAVADTENDAEAIRLGANQDGAATLVEVRPRVPMDVVNRFAKRAAKVSIWALVEAAALKAELKVLTKLAEVVAEGAGQNKLRDLVNDLKVLHSTALAETSRPPLDLEPLQRLIWVCESADSDSASHVAQNMPPAQLRAFVRVILLDGMYRWHRALWKNATSFWAEAMEDEQNAAPVLDCGILDILRGIATVKPTAHTYGGPVILERGVNSRFALRFSADMHRVPTYAHPGKKDQLLSLVAYLTSEKYATGQEDVARDDARMLVLVVLQFLESHEKAFTAEVYAAIMQGVRGLGYRLLDTAPAPLDVHLTIREITVHFEQASTESVKLRLCSYLGPCLTTLGELLHAGPERSAALRGRAWMNYSVGFLRSYIPDVPVDPASGPAVKLKFMEDDLWTVRTEIKVREEMEVLMTGNKDNALIRDLLARAEVINAPGKGWMSRVALRPERTQMREILNDLKLLNTHLLSDAAVSALIAGLLGTSGRSEAVANQEAHLQETLAALVARLETKYPLYRDILQPVYLAVYQFKYGLRLMAEKNVDPVNGNEEDVEKLLEATVKFVDDGTMENVELMLPTLKRLSSRSNSDPMQLQMIIGFLSRMHASLRIRATVRPATLGPVHVLFGSLVDIWSEVEQRRLDKEKADADLYKYKERKHDLMNEDEIDEAMFKERFPDFYTEFEDVLPRTDDNKAAPVANSTPADDKKDVGISTDVAQDVRLLHRDIVMSWIGPATPDATAIEDIWKKAFVRSYRSAAELLRSCNLFPSRQLDQIGRGGYLYMTSTQLRTLTMDSADEYGAPGSRYDFYRDANVCEARRIHEILSALDRRLGELLAQWPDHAVLLQLAILCERISGFPVTSPVMKLLTGLELLIQKCQDWEPYASRDVSLKPHMEAITALVVRWRKLELRSWRELLEVEDRKSEESASAMWFHLWKVVVGIAVQSGPETEEGVEQAQDIQVLVKDLLAMLDQFCLSSSLGEFHTRLDMINVFHQHLCAVAPTVTGSGHGRFLAVANVLHNVYRYYLLFGDTVKAHIDRLRKPIWKELNGYVQIATWKDVNVYALKESAKRTHYHLHKFVKKYRAILDLPVRDAITAYHDDVHSTVPDKASTRAAVIAAPNAENIVSDAPVPALVPTSAQLLAASKADMVPKLEHLVTRMRKHTRVMVADSREQTESVAIEELASTILTRIRDFQEMNATLEAGSKAAKGQKSVRKKALVDLLKYLAYLGISARCTQRYLDQRESAFIYTLPKITLSEESLKSLGNATATQVALARDTFGLWNKADSYFYRVLAKMSKVRDMEVSASPDLSRPEVEKAISYLEHLLRFAIEQRGTLSAFVTQHDQLRAIAVQVEKISTAISDAHEDSGALSSGAYVTHVLASQKDLVDQAVLMTVQASMLIDTHVAATNLDAEVQAPLQAVREVLLGLKRDLDQKYACHVASGGPALASQSIVQAAVATTETIFKVAASLRNTAQRSGQIAYVFEELGASLSFKAAKLEGLMTMEAIGAIQRERDPAAQAFNEKAEEAVKSILLSFQALLRKDDTESPVDPMAPAIDDEDEDEFGLKKQHVSDTHKRLTSSLHAKHISAVFAAFNALAVDLERSNNESSAIGTHFVHVLQRLYPLLEQYLLVVQYRLFEYLLQHKSMLKLAYVLCNTFGQLFKNGYCVPREGEDEGGEGGEGVTENVDGTGIGEGEGKKDVSDEIENEGQVEGMQNEKQQPEPEKKIEDEDNGIEMDDDFEGKMEDMELEDQDEQDDDEKEDAENGEEPDEQMGEVDGDENVVDEKMWGDEDDDKDEGGNGQDDKVERDAPVKDLGGETEMAAKENGGQDDNPDENKKEKEKQKEKQKEGEQEKESGPQNEDEDGGDQEEGIEDMINEDKEDNYEDNHGVDVKPADQPDDKEAGEQEGEEEEDLKLPDQMDLDGDGGEDESAKPEDGDVGPDDMDLDMPPTDDQQLPDQETNEAMDQTGDAEKDENDAGEEAGDDGEEKLEPESLAEQEDQGEENEAAEQEKNNIQDSANGFTEDQQPEDQPEHDQDKDTSQAVDDQIQMSTQPFGVQGASGQKSNANMQEDAMADDVPDQGEEGTAQDSTQGGETKKQDHKSDPATNRKDTNAKKDQKGDPNPRRSVGDALKKWMSRLKNISDAPLDKEEEADTNNAEQAEDTVGDDAMDFEFVQEDEQASDTQAMADATAEQLGEMDRKALADDKEEKEYGQDMEPNQEEGEQPAEEADEPESKAKDKGESKNKRRADKPAGAIELGKQDDPEDEEGEQMGKKNDPDAAEEDAREQDHNDEDMEMEGVDFGRRHPLDRDDDDDEEEDEDSSQLLDTQSYEEMRRELEQSVAEWRESGQDPAAAQDLWRNYTTLTRDLSFALCEQLRLILEPTLATKLKGDYRTGKRLNMRKIIPYIASQFKKDKIWLRRTKPSKRTYQIMIAIDDSRSMAESRSVQLAYESLAVITKALTQLEAGDVSVLSFGDDIKLLHPFDRPFSDEAGADVIRRFTFGQDRTRVREMMDTAMSILEHARTTATVGPASDLWQLQLVLSDGICEDHELVRSLVRRAAEQRIMVVFIVLDNRGDEKNSITQMQNITYGTDPKTGVLTLQRNRYMDTFPFDYYVVVKDVTRLPEVLADTLRQYFMFVS
ncbi:hypothetical protein DFJ77DRAFT_488317 [Powellomyces hirtus]|nr:hypothetical protein DFJ77DRAFT_488317 [Powellomyces hirtus]